MNHEELFLKEGASYFGNRLIWRNKDVGVIAPGVALVLTPEGEDVLKMLQGITDVEVKPAKSSRKSKEEAPVDDASKDVV